MNWFQQGVILFLFLIKCGARKYISFIASEMYYLFFKQKGLFSLFARQNYNEREGKTERSSICLFTPPMASIAGTKLGQSQEGGVSSRSHMRVEELKDWGHPLLPPQNGAGWEVEQSDSNWYIHGILALQDLALPTMSQRWPQVSFYSIEF